jgi:peptidoglycan hydrolase CwlO-like protein
MVEMMMDREKSTDDPLSALDKKVDVGFAQIGMEFEKVDERFASIDKSFEEVDARFEKVDARFEKVEGKIDDLDSKFDAKFDGLNKTLLWSAVGVIGALIGCCATLVGIAVL